MFGNMIADTYIKPFQSPVFGNPSSYGLDYEDVTFVAEDGVKLSGWLIKGAQNNDKKEKVIIQSHFGVQCCRSGYTPEGKGMIKGWDGDISFLRQAQYLVEAGYSVLMYDFRNHGNSEAGTLPYISWAEEEGKDVIAAVKYISEHPTYKDADIGLLSICMGQGASVAAYGRENSLKNYPNIKTMIAVQPMDYGCFVKQMGMPGFINRSTDKAIIKKTGRDYNKTSWTPHIKDVAVPTLVIQNRNDSLLDEGFINNYLDQLTVEKDMLWIELPKRKANLQNRMAAYNWIGENPEPIVNWFDNHMGK